jgi:hypothetical protein
MASLEGLILRHYFESQGFLVRQCLPGATGGVESLRVINPNLKKRAEIPPIIFSSDLEEVHSALLWLPNWSALKVSPSLLKNPAELAKFIDKRLAERKTPAEIAESGFWKIVVVPSVPTEEPHRSQTIALLKARGIDAMLSMRGVLQDLISRTDPRKPREGLQLIEVLANFDLLKNTQMELFYDERHK